MKKTAFEALVVFALAAVAVTAEAVNTEAMSAEEFSAPRWISVMPTPEDGIGAFAQDVAFLGRETVVDSVAYSCTLVPEGEKAVDKAALYAKLIAKILPAVRALAPKVRQGILLQATMGHGWTPSVPTPWQKVVRRDGSEMYKFCPLNPAFLDYVENQCRQLGALGADFFMLDDDTRLITGVNGCYCPLHLAEFARRTGVKRTREEIVEACANDPALAAEWDRLLADSIASLAERVRRAFPERMPGIFCCCSKDAHHARRLAAILAAPGQRAMVRLNGAPYLNRNPFDNVKNLANLQRERAMVGEGVDFLCEADTCPQTRYATSARRWLDYMELAAFSGIRGAKIWITRIGNPHERKSAEAYRRAFAAETGFLRTLEKADLTPTGVVSPTPFSPGVQPSFHRNWTVAYLSQMGVPCRVGAWREGETAALAKGDVAKFSDAELRRFLAGPVLLDGSAAVELTRRGFGPLIGVEAKEWTAATVSEHEFADGAKISGGAKAADLGKCDPRAEVTGRFYHKTSALNAERTGLAPAALRFTNSAGGRVAIFADELPSSLALGMPGSEYYCETYRREVVAALAWLGGGSVPGGVRYDGDAPVWCQTAKDGEGRTLALFDNLDLDRIGPLELVFGTLPKRVERLRDDGGWEAVPFSAKGSEAVFGTVSLETMRPVVLRFE